MRKTTAHAQIFMPIHGLLWLGIGKGMVIKMSSEKYMLELEHIKKSYYGVNALIDMSLRVKEGEIHAIVGENGAGKSTLIKIIAGVHQPDDGIMTLYGAKRTFTHARQSLENGISVIYQETSLFPDLTVVENLFVGNYPRNGIFKTIDKTAMENQAIEIFEQFGLNINIHQKVETLSIAMKQIVEIAKAIWRESKIVIMDEPTASLSEKEVDVLFNMIHAMKAKGTSVIYISHRLEELFRISDTVTVIRDGSFVATMPLSETNKDDLISLMVGRNLSQLYPERQPKSEETVLEVQNLQQGSLVNDISFTLRRGEVLGFAGIAGAGRTEMAQALVGLEPKHSGKILLNGKMLNINRYKDALEAGIAYVTEDRGKFGLILPMSIKDNITLKTLLKICKFRFINFGKDKAIAQDYMEKLRIRTPHERFLVQNLSGGNQQKVSIAKALTCNPAILILDEPTRGVDVGAKSEIHKIINDRAQEGAAIILITSEMPELLGMCDRILVMQGGCIVEEFSREDATQEKILAAAIRA